MSTDSAVSIGVLVVILGATWRFAVILTEIKVDVKAQKEKIQSVPDRLTHIEYHFGMLEDDLNNLWAKFDGRPLDDSRRSRFKPLKVQKDNEE